MIPEAETRSEVTLAQTELSFACVAALFLSAWGAVSAGLREVLILTSRKRTLGPRDSAVGGWPVYFSQKAGCRSPSPPCSPTLGCSSKPAPAGSQSSGGCLPKTPVHSTTKDVFLGQGSFCPVTGLQVTWEAQPGSGKTIHSLFIHP